MKVKRAQKGKYNKQNQRRNKEERKIIEKQNIEEKAPVTIDKLMPLGKLKSGL